MPRFNYHDTFIIYTTLQCHDKATHGTAAGLNVAVQAHRHTYLFSTSFHVETTKILVDEDINHILYMEIFNFSLLISYHSALGWYPIVVNYTYYVLLAYMYLYRNS